MSLATLMDRTCEITRRSVSDASEEDSGGNKIPTETTATHPCYFEQRQRSERADADEISETRWLLVLPPEAAIHTGDAVTVDGETYEVIGERWRAHNPSTHKTQQVEVTVKRVAGAGDEEGS